MNALQALWAELEDLQRESVIISDEQHYWNTRSAALLARRRMLLQKVRQMSTAEQDP